MFGEPHPEEGAVWDRYFEDLKEKIKKQREKIRKFDEK